MSTQENKIFAKDLRLGNYLQSLNGITVRVCKIEEDQLSVEEEKQEQVLTTSYDYIKALPVNQQLLEKSGFITPLRYEEHTLYLHPNLSSSMYIEHTFSKVYSFCLSTEDGQFIDVVRSFQYVHELQNIFFALTGFELEIGIPAVPDFGNPIK